MSCSTLQDTFDAYWKLSARTRAKRYLKAVHPSATREEIDAIVEAGVPEAGTAQSRRIASARGKIMMSYSQRGPSPGLKKDGTPKLGRLVAYDAAPGGAANKAAMQAALKVLSDAVAANPAISQAQLDAIIVAQSKH